MADFVKYQALGNDYLLIDPRLVHCPQDPRTVRALCDRHLGIGADGVLFGPTTAVLPGEPVGLTLFNSDGSACGRSANGIRMFALHLAGHGPGPAAFTVRTAAGDSLVEVCDPATGLVRIAMGKPSFEPPPGRAGVRPGGAPGWDLDVDGRVLSVVSVANGNPHTVVLLDDASEVRARELGPRIAGHALFPERTNVEIARVPDRGLIEVWVWERGAGYTLASGSGGCAAAAAAHALGLTDDAVTVRMPGGDVRVTSAADGCVTLTGVVEQVAAGDLSPVLRERLGFGPGPHATPGPRNAGGPAS